VRAREVRSEEGDEDVYTEAPPGVQARFCGKLVRKVGASMTQKNTIPFKIAAIIADEIDNIGERLAFEVSRLSEVAKTESPIEQLFLAAMWTKHASTVGVHGSGHGLLLPGDDVNPNGWRSLADLLDLDHSCLFHFASQIVVGDYRVDFLFATQPDRDGLPHFIAVECDGHEFHEKTKEQAARDKRRDRYLVDQGIQVVRFAGSEIWARPSECASEVYGIIHNIWERWALDREERRNG